MSIYRITQHCFAINLEEIPSRIVLKVFLWLLCMIKWSKWGRYLDNINIWGHFWSKCGHLTPGGLHVLGYSPLLWHLFRRNTIMLCPECIFGVTLYYQMVQIGKLFGYYQYYGSFLILVKMWLLDPQGYPPPGSHCFAINFEEIQSCFVLNVYLWSHCIIKWSK